MQYGVIVLTFILKYSLMAFINVDNIGIVQADQVKKVEPTKYIFIIYIYDIRFCIEDIFSVISPFITYLVQIKAFLYDQYDRK